MCKECLDYKRRCLALGLSGMCYDQPDFRSYKGIESRGIIKRKRKVIRGTREEEEFCSVVRTSVIDGGVP